MTTPAPIVCERSFQQIVDGAAVSFRVVWMQPVADGNDWACEYRIEWPDRTWKLRRIFGVDSTQALILAMQTAAAELYGAEPPVFWFEPDDTLGLPLSPGLADLEAARKGRIVPVLHYAAADAEALSVLYAASVRGLGAAAYSPTQVEAWASVAPSAADLHARMADGRFRVVARGDTPIGFIDVEPDGHIDLFYVAPEAAGKGAASHLYACAEEWAHTNRIDRLYVEASEMVRPFLERRGFVVTARRDFEVAGVAIHNYAMEKQLT